MPSLLRLPQELRDLIIEFVVTSRGTAPTKIDTLRPTEEHDDLNYVSRISGRGVFYSTQRHRTSPVALLLVNHQIHDETKGTLKRLSSSNGNKYTLDVILLNEALLFPSWTSVPPLHQNVDTLSVTFRIFGFGGSAFNDFMDLDGSTGPAVWRFYSLLERFLRCGATRSRSPNEDREFHLQILDLNVEMPADIDKSRIAPADLTPDNLPKYRRDHSPHDMVMHPATLAKFIYIWVQGILMLSDPIYASPGTPIPKYAKLFFDRVGKIRISVDGKRKFEIDVKGMVRRIAERDAGLSGTPPIEVDDAA